MNTGAVVEIVIGAVVLVFLAVNWGVVNAGVQVGVGPGGVTTTRGIVAPQPSANYGGYLAASTAPGVAGALNGALTGLGHALAGWLTPPTTPQAAPAQGASASSPSLFAQPSGPSAASAAAIAGGIGIATPGGGTYAEDGWAIGPQIDPVISYNSTGGSAFDWAGLSADNAYDPSAALPV